MNNLVARELLNRLEKVRDVLDEINTPNLSSIKEIIKSMHFADITSEQQILDNKGDVIYKKFVHGKHERVGNINLSYTIKAKKTGLAYGRIQEEIDKKTDEKKITFKYVHLSNYARFISDLIAEKVIYSKELKCFLIVEGMKFTKLDEVKFILTYPIDKKLRINDFLEVLAELFEKYSPFEHGYSIKPYTFAGIDWIYDCKKLLLDVRPTDSNNLYFDYFEVKNSEFNFEMASDFINMIANDDGSFNNLSLMHAYVMYRKLDLAPAEQMFFMKDFGRTGKGLFLKTFYKIFKVNPINFDLLVNSTGYGKESEWMNFYGAEVAHANETGEIDNKGMVALRKIATGEVLTGRSIGGDNFKFKNRSVLILDTNEQIQTNEITANKSRIVNVALKDRPKGETTEQRYKVFEPYWEFVAPNDEAVESASLSFLILSLENLKALGGKFNFEKVTLKNFFSADELTETQKLLLQMIHANGFIFAGDEILQKAIESDYGNLRFKKAKDDIKAIGVKLNEPKWIEGQNMKVNVVGDEELFKSALALLEEIPNP